MIQGAIDRRTKRRGAFLRGTPATFASPFGHHLTNKRREARRSGRSFFLRQKAVEFTPGTVEDFDAFADELHVAAARDLLDSIP